MNRRLTAKLFPLRNLSSTTAKTYPLQGGCYCGNIKLNIQLSKPPSTYSARECDCGFCKKNGAAYISDPDGKLEIRVKDTVFLGRFKQEKDGNAEFIHCKNCSVLIGAIHQCPENQSIIGAINRRAIDNYATTFTTVTPVSPRLLEKDEKVNRWKEKWFKDVQIFLGKK
jgi:hypothetical protein